MIFYAEIYSREASNAKYELKSDTNELTVYFDPKSVMFGLKKVR